MKLIKQNILGYIIAGLIIPVYIFTTLIELKIYAFYILLLLITIIQGRVLFNKNNDEFFIFCGSLFLLILLGITGWFNSPFLTYAYILILALSFLFHYSVSIIFILIFLAIFLFKGETTNIYYSFLSIISYLVLIPLSYFIRRKYLYLSQAEKKILILIIHIYSITSRWYMRSLCRNKLTKSASDEELLSHSKDLTC